MTCIFLSGKTGEGIFSLTCFHLYYDPETCSFVNGDGYVSTGQGFTGDNMFTYCLNSPVLLIDKTGTLVALANGCSELYINNLLAIKSHVSNSAAVIAEKKPIDSSVPLPSSSGYVPPKKNPNPQKVPNPNGSGKGWPSEGGGVWVPDNKQHGGPGWTEQFPGGKHKHHYPDGHVREISLQLFDLDLLIGTGLVVTGIVASAYIIINDVTAVGVADDWLLGPTGWLITKGGILIFG